MTSTNVSGEAPGQVQRTGQTAAKALFVDTSGGGGGGGGPATIADGADVTLGAKADAKSTATDTTAITAMSVWKQISSSVQAVAASLAGTLTVASHAVTNAGTFAVQAAITAASGAIASGAIAAGAIVQLPSALGQAAAAASLSVVPASNYAGIGVQTLTPVLDTSIYADGDILFDTIVLNSVFLTASGVNILESVHVLDEDDQGVAFDLVFLNALTSLGTINAAPSISDANARNILGFMSVASGDYIDIGGSRLATIRNIGMALTTGATTLWVAGITRGGTPTYTASGLKIKLGFLQQG